MKNSLKWVIYSVAAYYCIASTLLWLAITYNVNAFIACGSIMFIMPAAGLYFSIVLRADDSKPSTEGYFLPTVLPVPPLAILYWGIMNGATETMVGACTASAVLITLGWSFIMGMVTHAILSDLERDGCVPPKW